MMRFLVIFAGIVLFAAILRLFYLGRIPLSLEWDEVALGYDAYSILQTGKDQFGKFLPITFRSLDDYKPPLYVYMAIPSVFIFGLTEFATRLPSAVFGIGAVFLTYFLVIELFDDIQGNFKYFLALMATFLLALSPWHLQFSRAAFETNLSVTVTLLAVYMFLRGVKGSKFLFILSAVFFGLSFFSYHSTRVVTPLLLISLLILFRNDLPAKKFIYIFLGIYAVFILAFIPIAISPEAQIRFRVTNDFNSAYYQDQSAKDIVQDGVIHQDAQLVGKILHNRRLEIYNYDNLMKVIRNYLLHFSPEFLFVKGDAPLHHAPGFGMMYFFEAPLLYFGILYYILRLRSKKSFILFMWMLVGPLPASVTWPAPHSVRSEIILPTLQIFSAIGLLASLVLVKKHVPKIAPFFMISLVMVAFYGMLVYFHQYYIHTNIELSKNWLYGRKEAVEFTESIKDRYDRVLVSMKVDMPYIFWLFYTKHSPSTYLSKGGTVSGGFADERNKFDKYEFRNFDSSDVVKPGKTLFVTIPSNLPPGVNILKTIHYIDGTQALTIAEN